MQNKKQFQNSLFRIISRAAAAALAIATVFSLTMVLTRSAQAQTYTVLHNFTGGGDGGSPQAGLTMDRPGNLYGTATAGGAGFGAAFKLSKKGSGWVFAPLYSFQGGSDGAVPTARVIFGPDGGLYGTTSLGGAGYGAAFNLKPYPTACKTALCGWQETVLYGFSGGSDGANPLFGDLIFDQAGNLYGTTYSGGVGNCDLMTCGVVYKLTPSNGGWTETVLYSFTGGSDGALPFAGLIFDNVGKLYGTTAAGGNLACDAPYGCGTVFQLTPSGSGWTENVLYTFQGGNDGDTPDGGLIFDKSGNLYGTTSNGGAGGGGTVFELIPSNGRWTLKTLYSFTGSAGGGPQANLVMDGAGNLYGTTVADGASNFGSVFKLTLSGNNWIYTDLHDFCINPDCSDGAVPISNVIFDANGNLYGTAYGGGMHGNGVVWEITP